MKQEELLSKLFRLPINKCLKLYENFMNETKVDATTFAIHQQVADIIGEKIAIKNRIREDVFDKTRMYLALMISKDSIFSKTAYEELKRYPIIIWTELIGDLNESEIMIILNEYGQDMPSVLIENLIMNLPEEKQSKVIRKYKNRLDSTKDYFQSFYYCVGESARKTLKNIFKDAIQENPLLYIEDLKEEELLTSLTTNKKDLLSANMDALVEQILLKTKDPNLIFSAIEIFGDRIQEISDIRFKLLVRRTVKLLEKEFALSRRNSIFDENDSKDELPSIELELFKRFQKRFYSLGLLETLELLNVQVNSYDDNKIGNEIIFSFLDIAYDDESLRNFVNDKTLKELINRFQEQCQNKKYTLEDLDILVSKIKNNPPYKLIKDDYIEAMIACGQLMKNKLITDKSPSFIKLRTIFIDMLNNSTKRDGTYNENINLNGIFYRLIKGTLDFDKVLTTKTYKGLIYLTKSGDSINSPDEITQYLSDEQVAKLDIKPLLRWRKEWLKKETKEATTNTSSQTAFLERMGLQLLCYFGEHRTHHILNSGVSKNRLENLFDNIDYSQVKINQNGKPIINTELMNFLFGRGSISEKNTIINKILRGELLDFGRVLKEICNNYENIKEECHGILTVKRIINYFANKNLPIKLKPNEHNFGRALCEMQTMNPITIQKGIDLCHSARKRVASTIPKISGKVGDFTYEILDLKDPFALAVGYLSHCCFVVDGVSHSALNNSMSSENGRTFVVYYKGKFLAQSWIWRNGDIVCFDSVEAGGYTHGIYKDDLRVLDVYKRAASEILYKSQENETQEECVKAVTVGNSDYVFENLEEVEGKVPRPLDRDVYVYDSNHQRILCGQMPQNPRTGSVSVKYYDPRGNVHAFLDIEKAKEDDLDEALLKLQSIKYDLTSNAEPEIISEINQLFVGDDWYIKTTKSGEIDAEILPGDKRAVEECKQYAKVLGIEIDDDLSLEDGYVKNREETVKQLKLTKLSGNRGN